MKNKVIPGVAFSHALFTKDFDLPHVAVQVAIVIA